MASRSDMDRPATVTAAVLGLVLIGVTIPYFVFSGDAGATDYTVTWSEATAASAEGPVGTQVSRIEVPVANVRVSNLTVEFAACNDNTVQGLYGPVTITFRILDGTTAVPGASGTATCGNSGPFQFAVSGRPDIGEASADSAADAVAGVWADAGDDNRTTTYVLEVSSQRGAGTLPVTPPAGGPTFSATAVLTVQAWRATANAPDQEVPR
mgnify:CR=1 FL=1